MNSANLKRIFMLVLIFFLSMIGIYGCGSDSGTQTGSGTESGQVTLGLTDGAGEFASYNVGVASIILTTEDGVKVEVMPEDVMVDFAQYEDTTELVVTTDVPVGVYTSVTVTLDYTDVDVTVENGQGEIVGVDVLVDADGDPVTQVAVHVLDVASIEVSQGSHTYVNVDFDLEASHTVTYDSENGTVVVVTPHVSVNVDYSDYKDLRVRGTVVDVLPGEGEFYVNLKPFFLNFNQGYNGFGEIMVASRDTTLYYINGETYEGLEGLEALAESGENTPVIAKGQVAFEPFSMIADTVYAGTSIPGMNSDYVTGIIKNLYGDVVLVGGMVYDHVNMVTVFNSAVTVNVSGNTTVTRPSGGTYTLDDLAVGQYVMIAGDLDETETGKALDASQGTLWLYGVF